jgi:arginyl-tRNA synthetase
VYEMLEQLSQALSTLAQRSDFSVIPLHNLRRDADARIYYRGMGTRAAGGEPGGAARLNAARDALAELPDVAAVRTRGDSLMVRFTDEHVARLGARLEAGEGRALDAGELLGGAEVVVNFCDANPTKALHIGHLRNIALGQALAGALTAAGARVTRQSQVSDYCRSMGEALAGYMELPQHITPRSLGVKSDHFVGDCFARYAAKLTAQSDAEGAEDPALSAEAAVRHDLADELLERVSAGDPEMVTRWRRLRGWALAGQEATLAALSVKLDRLIYESDSRPTTGWILDRGLAGGVLTRTESGAVVYETREEEYPRLLLARSDGFPTQHLRTIALWHSLRETLEGTRSIELVGEEWHAYVRYHERMVHGTRCTRGKHYPSSNVIYGMVTVEGGAVKSSNGRPPLIDGLLERLAGSREVEELAARSEGRFKSRSLAALIALGLYLGRPTRRPVDLTLTEMLDLSGGVGWELARAAVCAWSPRYDGAPDPAPEDARYRQAVLQSQVYRRLLARAVEQLDVYELARFYGHLSRRYLASDGDGRTARAMRTLLAAGLGALGLPCAQTEGGAVR